MNRQDHHRLGRWQLWTVLLALICGSVVTGFGGPATSRRTGEDALRVSTAFPIGDVRRIDSIDLVFNQEMVPNDRRGTAASRPPLEFEPEIEGDFFWIGSRAVSFFPRGEIAPGTELLCRVRKETRSRSGEELSSDFVWKIIVGRPELLATYPLDDGKVASNAVLYLQFSLPPAEGAERFVRLIGPKGEIPCARELVDPKTIPAEIGARNRPEEPIYLLALRPEALAARTRYKLTIDPGIPFVGSDVGLLTEGTLRFRTYGEPKLLTVTRYREDLLLEFAAPIDRETLRAHFSIDPNVPGLLIAPDSGSTFLLSGDFVNGRSYSFHLRAGLHSLQGERLSSDQIRDLTVRHATPGLRFAPQQGYLPRGFDAIVELTATNIDSVEIFGKWIDPDNVALGLFRTAPLLTEELPMIGTWSDPGLYPDSTHRLDLPLTLLGKPPRGGQVAAIRARGNLLFPTAQQVPGRLTHTLLQITDLALSVHVGDEAGVAWVTRLSSGNPLDQAELRLFIRAKDQPIWQGETDRHGLIRIPGWNDLGLPPRSAIVAQARTNDDAVWVRLQRHDSPRGPDIAGGDSLQLRGSLWTDRSTCRPGEALRWVVFARRVGQGNLAPAGVESLGVRIEGEDGIAPLGRGSLELTTPGNGSGWFPIPLHARTGRYALILTEEPNGEGAAIASRSFEVVDPWLHPYRVTFDLRPPHAVSGSILELSASFRHLSGMPAAYTPIRWTLHRRPEMRGSERFEDFAFGDSLSIADREGDERGRRIGVAAGSGRLDVDGRIDLRHAPSLDSLHEDQIYTLEIVASGPTGEPIVHTHSFPVRQTSFRTGARARVLPGPGKPAIEFEAVAVDSVDHAIDGIEMRWSIASRSYDSVPVRSSHEARRFEEVPRDTILKTGEGVTTVEPLSIRWTPPGPGTYTFFVDGRDAFGGMASARDVVTIEGLEINASARRTADRALLLQPEREEHAPGDTARVLLRSPPSPTEGLVLLLDEGIRKVQRLSNVRGEPRMLLPLDGYDPPGVWLRTILISRTINPHDIDTLRELPYYGSGQIYLPIHDAGHELQVEIEPDRDEVAHNEELLLRIRLRDHSGLPVPGTATVAVVEDKGESNGSAGRPDPLGAFFPLRPDGATYADTRSRLRDPTPRNDARRPTPPTEPKGATPVPKDDSPLSISFDPLLEIGPEGEVTVALRFREGPRQIRIRVLGTSGPDRFGYAETRLRIRERFRLDKRAPAFVRETDEVEIAAAVRADTNASIRVKIEADVEGADVDGNRSRQWKLKPNERRPVSFRLKEPDASGISLRLRAEGAGHVDTASIAIPVERALIWNRSFTYGRAAPHFRTTVRPEIDPLADLGGLTTMISPSILGGLEEAVTAVTRTESEGLEQLSNRLLAHGTSASLLDYLDSVDEASAKKRHDAVSEILSRIARCIATDEAYAWPTPQSPEASNDQVGYALYSVASAIDHGYRTPSGLIERLDRIAEDRLLGLGRGSNPDLAQRQILEHAPWLIWARVLAGQHIESGADTVHVSDIEQLFLRRKEAPVESRIALGLIVANLLERSRAARVGQGWRNLLEVSIQEIREAQTERKGRHVWVSSSREGRGDRSGGDERATALFLQLLATHDPWNEDLPGMIAWLLEERRPDSGTWANPHTTALVLDLLVATVAGLEGPRSEVSGKLGIGSAFEDFLFRRSGPVQILRETPMVDLLSADGRPAFTQLRVDTDGRRSIYVTAMLEEARSALRAPPHESGLIIDRQFLSGDGERLIETVEVGEPVLVRLSIALFEDAKTLVVEDPLPAGFTVPSLRFQIGRGDASGRQGERDGPDRFRIVHKERTDRFVRFHAASVPAGVHHIYYTAFPTTVGRFVTPGARAECASASQIHGRSAPQEIRIKEKR